jgi:uncharacterized membrane protein (DUF373 family)
VIVVYVGIEMIELIYLLLKAIFTANDTTVRLIITKEQTALVLPVFFNILIVLELLETFSVYVKEHRIKVQNILLIGLIAIGRKLLVLDVGHNDGVSNIGLAAIILALAIGYYLVKKPNQEALSAPNLPHP